MARFRGRVHKKALPRDANDLQVIREDTKRKFARSDFQRPLTQEIVRDTQDLFIPEPITPITISPLTDSAAIFTPGLVPSGSSTNLGPFQPAGFESGGPDESPVYRVNADNQGLHARNVWKTIDPTRGGLSIWLRSHDTSGSGTNNYVFNVGDNLVVRYESGTGQLRFYPDLANDSDTFMFVNATNWWTVDGIWNELRIAWDYANQLWKMTWGDMEGTQSGSSVITFPGWNEFTYVSFFTDLSNANNVYQDCSFLNVGSAEFDPVAMLRFTDMFEPTGFKNKGEDSTIAFSDSGPDRTFTITPSGTSFSYYIGAVRYSKSVAETIQLADTDGIWWIYYDEDTLTSVNAPTHTQIKDIFLTKASVAVVYWNSTFSEGKLFEERHGDRMDGDTHVLHHETIGMAYDIGLALGNILADESGDLDSHAQFSNTSGQVFDEDIEFDILAVASTTGLEIFYMDAAGTWTWTTNAGFSVIDDGVGTRLAYNQIGVGLTEVSNNSFVLCHVFATNIESNELIAIVGQEEYGNIAAAQAGAETEILSLLLGDLITEEMLPIATVIFQTSDSYGNAVKARIRSTSDGDDYIDWRRRPILSGGATSVETLDDIYNNSVSGDKTIIVDDGAVTLKSADETVLLIDSDIAVSAGVTLADKFQWQEDIVVADGDYTAINSITQTSKDADITSDFSALESPNDAEYDYKWLDLNIDIIGGGAGTTVTSSVNVFDVDIVLSGVVIALLDASSTFINFKVNTVPLFQVTGAGIASANQFASVGDPDTFIDFPATDRIDLQAGGVDFIYIQEDDVQDFITFNEDGVDIDFRAESLNKTHMWFIEAAKDVVGINTSAPSDEVELDINGSLALREGPGLVLSNGANANIDIGDFSFHAITGPDAVYNISGFSGIASGRMLIIDNLTAQTLTILNQNAGSLIANRIATGGGNIDVTAAGYATFIYSGSRNRWILLSHIG